MSLAKRELRPPPVLTQDSQGPQTVIPVQAIIIRSDPVHSSGLIQPDKLSSGKINYFKTYLGGAFIEVLQETRHRLIVADDVSRSIPVLET